MVIATPPATVPPTAALAGSAPTAAHASANPAPFGWVSYVVKRGDTAYGLAVHFRTTVAALVAKNHLAGGGHLLQPGQRLLVPRTATQAAAEAKAAAAAKAIARAKAAAAAPTTYVVRSGDTLSTIAARFHTPLAKVLKLNRLGTRSVIHPGQRILVPRNATQAAATKRAASKPSKVTVTMRYSVRPGDTLSSIGARYAQSVPGLMKLNRLSSSVIYPGQRLIVKVATKAASTGGATLKAPSTTPTRAQVKALITATARRHGVDRKLALAIGWQESGWQQNVVSEADALGIMQVIPVAGRWASDLNGRTLNLYKAHDNVTAGVVILRALTRMADNQDQAIAAYYQGLTSVRTNGMYADTKAYVRSVKALMKRM